MSSRLPTEPGRYYWDEWNKAVNVYAGRGTNLWVRVWPHWQPVKISPRIAGTFTRLSDDVTASSKKK
jgi:hypothetical protein